MPVLRGWSNDVFKRLHIWEFVQTLVCGWLLPCSTLPSRTSGTQLLQFFLFFLSVPPPKAGDGNADGRGRGGTGEMRRASSSITGPVPRKPMLTHAVCSCICVHGRESSQVFNETSPCEQGLGKTVSCFATALPLTLLCSTTPNFQGTLPRLLRCPTRAGNLGTHVLVASYEFPCVALFPYKSPVLNWLSFSLGPFLKKNYYHILNISIKY